MRSIAASVTALLAAVLVGCASASPAPQSTSSPDAVTEAPAEPPAPGEGFEAAWLDDGRALAVLSWGSSSCAPQVVESAAEAQTITVTLADAADDDVVCTADYVPRLSLGAVPEGVDPTADARVEIGYGDQDAVVPLRGDAALTAAPGSPTEYAPSAGRFGDQRVALLTWGSSGCPPVVESASSDPATVTFVTDDDRICTMDMAPRLTLVSFDAPVAGGAGIALVGGGLDGTVVLRG